MQIQIYQIGNRSMLKVDSKKIPIKSGHIYDTLNGRMLTVEMPLNGKELFIWKKDEPSEQKERGLELEINIAQRNGELELQVAGTPATAVEALQYTLAAVIGTTLEPDTTLEKLMETANEIRDNLLKMTTRIKDLQ